MPMLKLLLAKLGQATTQLPTYIVEQLLAFFMKYFAQKSMRRTKNYPLIIAALVFVVSLDNGFHSNSQEADQYTLIEQSLCCNNSI